jgi:ABC-2 type transport system permease protein
MRNVLLVIRNEVLTTLSKRSFWLMTFIFPVAIILLNIGVPLIAGSSIEETPSFVPQPAPEEQPEGEQGPPAEQPSEQQAPQLGYVDHSGIIEQLPPSLPEGFLTAYDDEAAAQAALESGEISEYFILGQDYLESGEIVLVDRNYQPLGDTQESLMQYIINYNLTGDSLLAARIVDPAPAVAQHDLAPRTDNDADSPLTFFVPFAALFIFFFLLTSSSGFMLSSVTREKENRVVEILLLSLQPRQLMLGKLLGLSLVALFQMAIWVGGGYLLLSQPMPFFDLGAGYDLPDGFLLWAVAYFALGYLLYASLMAAVGALAPSAREAGQFTFIILLPLMIPLWLLNTFVSSPDGSLTLFLSLFPLTAPTSMITRMTVADVPLWQVLAGLLGLALTTYLVVSLAGRFFRADTLLSLAPLRSQRLLTGWRE